ncbi:MAG: FAD binding domain-containing protein [Thermoanaerobaculia bacterium]
MMRAPAFRYHAAFSAADAVVALASEPGAMLLAGGTDVIPKLKRRQQTPAMLISLRRAVELRGIAGNGELAIGAMTTLREIAEDARVRDSHQALFRAVSGIATPLIRNTATIGGNLALDTRCNYYDQNHGWREAIGFCKKCGDGDVCWVAPSSPRCWAVSSTDAAPALISLGARVTLLSKSGERDLALEDLYRDDGIEPLTKRHDELITAIRIPKSWRSTYWKLRRRGSFDFPVLGVAAAIRLDGDVVAEARVVLGAVASRPLLLSESGSLIGMRLTDDVIEDFAERAAVHAKPLDNTDFHLTWRKTMARKYLSGALRELRGDPQPTGGTS